MSSPKISRLNPIYITERVWLKTLYNRLKVLHCCDETSAAWKKIKSDVEEKINELEERNYQASGGALVRQVRPYLSEPVFSPKPSSFYPLPPITAVLQDAGRLVKDLIFSRARVAEDWTLCFEDKTKGELVVGYRPGADRRIQLEKVEASLRGEHLSIPPLQVEPFRATRGNGMLCRSSRCTDIRPIVGGIGIKIPEVDEKESFSLGTIGMVTKYQGKIGFFTAGHVVGNTEQIPVYQFHPNNVQCLIGFSTHVSDYNSGNSDSAFVELLPSVKNDAHAVFNGETTTKIKVQTNPKVGPGVEVCMEGAMATKTRKGKIIATNATIKFADEGDGEGFLENQYLADYRSYKGDSGGPVYTKDILIGLNVGCVDKITDITDAEGKLEFSETTKTLAIISKWENVINTVKKLNTQSPFLDKALATYTPPPKAGRGRLRPRKPVKYI